MEILETLKSFLEDMASSKVTHAVISIVLIPCAIAVLVSCNALIGIIVLGCAIVMLALSIYTYFKGSE
jgi:ABC-type protease/lipase transport system fused ATPase/permease subunit